MLALEEVSPEAIGERLGALRAGRALGVIVRGLVPAPALAATIDWIALHEIGLPRFEVAPGAHTLGCMLAPSQPLPVGPSLERYLDAASAIPVALIGGLHEALAALAGLPVAIPVAPDGRRYAPATLRIFASGAESPLHCDTYRELPCLTHLDSIADRQPHLSWYLTLVPPARGGDLVVVDRRHGEPSQGFAQATHYAIGAGDLVVFDAGRWFHQISRCEGERRTLGGFAAPSRDGRRLYAWG
jgi:hypothetical protein